jgi:hypothetical protein
MKDLREILELHKKWLNGDKDGEKANLSEADLRWADLSKADLSKADLRWADLSKADLSKADLRWADLSKADLSEADLSKADLRWADLSKADLRWANLSEANLSEANLSEADLSKANLSEADLSGAEGLVSTIDYLESHFEKTKDGYIAYKTFNSQYKPPEKWVIQQGSIITENVNFNRTNECGCGINVAPLDWVKNNYKGDIWKVLIKWEWLSGVCVPYHTDGKIRCERVQLLEVVE